MAAKARDLNTLGRLKEVGRWHFRGMSIRKIAELLEMSADQVRKDVNLIKSRTREFEDLDSYLKDLIARTGEELTKLTNHEAELYEVLDYAKEHVVKLDGFGQPIPKRDPLTGKPIEGQFEAGPRSPTQIGQTVRDLAAISKQRAELLKLIGPKVDISMNLQLQLQMQSRILEVIKEYPEVYSAVYQQLRVIAENAKAKPLAIAALAEDALDAEYQETEVERGDG